jgi:hypothetical protein
MSWDPWMGGSARARELAAILLTLWAIAGSVTAEAQNIVSRPPSFQAAGDQSFENQILDRLTQTGQFQPDDLPNLARLVVLESIAMLVDVRTDLADTPIGNRLGPDITELSEASEVFYESISAPPQDLADTARSLEFYGAVEDNFRRVESTLRELPGLSNQAAEHLRHVSRLMALLTPVMRDLQSNLPATISVPLNGSSELDSLRRQTRLLANDLVRMIISAGKPGEKRSGRDGVLIALEDLLDRVQGFDQALSLRPSNVDLEASIHALRRRFWRVEATIAESGWPADLRSGWQSLRERMNAISDDFGMPRVINLGTTGQSVAQPASVMPKRPIARIYRGSPGVAPETASK